jgi:protein involved in polysaccharide export with SLBB domain
MFLTSFMSLRPYVLITLLLTTLVATQSAQAQKAETEPPAPLTNTVMGDPLTFPIRVFDTVRIKVVNGLEFSGDFNVGQDGTIWINKLGKIVLSNATLTAAQNRIINRLKEKKQLVKPVVSVTIVGRKAREVIVSGEVKKRGSVPLREGSRLGYVIDLADPTENADLTRVSLVGKNDVERGPINYQGFLDGTVDLAKSNPKLQEGDVVLIRPLIVQEGRLKITGEVKDPKPFYVVTKSLTATQALQSAGGLGDLADKEKIIVRRNGQEIPVPYRDIVEKSMLSKDVILKNGDEIFIPKRERQLSYTVSGAVDAPNTLYPLREKSTALAAVLEARPREGAKLDKVRLIRIGESPIMIDIKKGQGDDIFLQDGDILTVPDPDRRGRTDIFNTIAQVAGFYLTIRQIQIFNRR